MSIDIAGRTILTGTNQDQYAVIDTTLSTTNVTWIDQLSGRQGEDGRLVYFAAKDGIRSHNLDNETVTLKVKDAQGVIKIGATMANVISSVGGLFSMLIPGEFYQAAGDVQEAYLEFNNTDTSRITTVNIGFRVLASGLVVTSGASQMYLQSVDTLIEAANARINELTDNITAADKIIAAAKTIAQQVLDQIKTGMTPILSGDNYFTGLNSFTGNVVVHGTVTVDNDVIVAGNSVLSLENSVLSLSNDVTDSGWLACPLAANVTGSLDLRVFKYKSRQTNKLILRGSLVPGNKITANVPYPLAKAPASLMPGVYHFSLALATKPGAYVIGVAQWLDDNFLYAVFPNDVDANANIGLYGSIEY